MENTRRALTIEDARIIFRNFAGKEGKYNREGDRNFCILLDPDTAERLYREGWNVKSLRAREEGDPEQPYIPVSVEYSKKPPKIVLVTWNGKTTLTEDECEIIDWIDIAKIDLILNPYPWAVNGKTGVKAYLNTLYVVVQENELDMKYRDLEELPARAGRAIEAAPDWVEGEVI